MINFRTPIAASLLALALGGCQAQPPSSLVSADTATQADPPPPPPAPEEAPPAAAPAPLPGRTDGCGEGMVRVEGEYCPAVIENCLEHHKEYSSNPQAAHVSERCLRYSAPTRCFSKERVHLSFCMDRYEYPNKVGELPQTLTPWTEATATCKAAGKRLCTEDEFNFACEGPEMLPYVYGYERDASKCNIDQTYEFPDQSKRLPTHEACAGSPFCAAEMQRLDKRHAIGAVNTCVSWAGVVDLNGNVNEWVNLPGKDFPNRSGLKGGWWGPVRGRCRPTTTFHKENDYGYEQGFRCCGEVAETASAE